jgi:predicted dehydrogenase
VDKSRDINIGMIGAGFMTKLHSIAYRNYPVYFFPPAANPVLHTVCDLVSDLAETAALRYGYRQHATEWQAVVDDPAIDLIDITTPNYAHADVAIAAARRGKHVYCEKPLANTLVEARAMLSAVEDAGVVHAVGYNNRRVPAVAFARELITRGAIGDIYNVRAEYLQDWAIDPQVPMEWRFDAQRAGTGAIGDIGSHAIDLIRFLIGEYTAVFATHERHVRERPVSQSAVLGGARAEDLTSAPRVPVTVDDSVEFIARFACGATGMFQASRFAYGNKNTLGFEIFGSRGAIRFSNDRLWELQYYQGDDPADLQGYRTLKMGPNHPYGAAFWPIADLGLGYADIKTIEISHLMEAIAGSGSVNATFTDGVKAIEICDAIVRSAEIGGWVGIG